MKIGVDIGTSMTKAVLYDDSMAPVAMRSRPTEMHHPAPGRYEHDLSSIIAAVIELLAELPSENVDLVAITGQGDGLWLVDDHGGPVRSALSWMDTRGAPDCQEWADTGVTERIFRSTGNAPFPGAGAALLSALRRDDPGDLPAAGVATQCQHAVFQALTGVAIATRAAAMLGVFDPHRGGYDEQCLRRTDLVPCAHLLPEIADQPVAFARITTELAGRTGLAATTQIATGPYDLPAAAFGAGVRGNGDGMVVVGTTLACLVHRDDVDPSGEPAGLTLCAADDVGFLRAMPTMVGTSALDWVLSVIGASHDDLDALLAESNPGAGGVAALPYLSPAGERAPFVDPRATAQFDGLNLSTTRADLVRALCESLGYAARQCLEAAGLSGEVTLCGGGTRSAALVSVFADTLARPVALTDEPEITARGAVAAAAAASRGADPSIPTTRRIEPSHRHRLLYQDGYARYLERISNARTNGWFADRRSSTATRPGATAPVPTPTHGPRALVKE